jgi:hypothetical protein
LKMSILARGSEQVRALELALGGAPPPEAAKAASRDLRRYMRERSDLRQKNLTKVNALLDRQRAPLIELLRTNQHEGVLPKEALELPPRPTPRMRSTRKIEPLAGTGSLFWLKTPPYDNQWSDFSGDADSTPDAISGNYLLSVTGGGGSSWACAGLGVNFFATEDNIQQRVAALVDYDYYWADWCNLQSAYDEAQTHFWVWGDTENKWVLQQNGLPPSWSDNISGFPASHGGQEESGTVELEAYFQAFGGNWYQAWVWSEGVCDDSSGFLGWSSSAYQWQVMQVPMVVFGSL